MLHGYLYLNLM